MKERLLTIGQAAELLNVSVKTLRIWDKEEKLKAYRTPNGSSKIP
jgi:excisionase family DNA binding protein